MSLVIIFFTTIIVIFSLIQWRPDKGKHARMAAAKRRAASAPWRGGWYPTLPGSPMNNCRSPLKFAAPGPIYTGDHNVRM